MSNTFISEHFEVVSDILRKSGYEVYSDPDLGLIIVQPSTNPSDSSKLDDVMKKKLLAAISNLGAPQMESSDLEPLVTKLLKASPQPLDRGFVSRLIVLLLNLYDERMTARVNGSTIEFSDRYQQGYMDLNLDQ